MAEQPGKETPHQFVSLLKSDNSTTILAYIPEKATAKIYNKRNDAYDAQWFNPVSNQYSKAKITNKEGIIEAIPPAGNDMVLVLKRKGGQK
ncbi:putative collagen-binding domain-containing protein [Pontibacter korlensis]|uniref:putative collagen-binding domain-containing protein n=1 Tax=Pontibacter korlensis TaxID=400092 RepID=UPI001F2206DC|nr:putative collagen-binding domain-containing protein [Pontibacter korlensis]